MSLPRLWVWLEGPHLEPFEALLDEFAALDVDLMLGPALVLQSGLGGIVALEAIGARCWLDLGIVVEVASAQALGRVVARSSARGVVVSAQSSAEALGSLVRSAAGRPVLVRCASLPEASGLAAWRELGVAGWVVDGHALNEAGVPDASALPMVCTAAWDARPPASAPGHGQIVRGLDRVADPLAVVEGMQARIRQEETHDVA